MDDEIVVGAGGIGSDAEEVAADADVAPPYVAGDDLSLGGEPLKGRRMIFIIASMALFMASIDSTIVASALNTIRSGLHARLNWVTWTITIYQLGQIIAMPLAGKLSDQFGRKRLFVLSIVLFTTASLACGLSTSIYMLIPLRFVQAIGGAAFMPSASGIVADHFGRDRDRALGMFSSVFPIGGIVGPALGGPIAFYFGWRFIFFINVPIGIVLFALAVRFLPQSVRRPSSRLDIRGVVLLATTILVGMTAITLLGEPGGSFVSLKFLIPLAGAVALGWRFARHTRLADSPFIAPRLLIGKGFATMNLLNVLFGVVAFGFSVLIPLYAEQRYGISQQTAGTVLSARAVGMIAVAAGAVFMLRRTGYRKPMVLGFFIIAVGVGALSVGARGLSSYWWLSIFALVTGVGMGIALPATNNASLHLAPNDVGAISGLRGMFRQSGGIIYVSVVSAILARSADPGLTQAHVFWVQIVLLVIMMLMVSAVPEHRGAW